MEKETFVCSVKGNVIVKSDLGMVEFILETIICGVETTDKKNIEKQIRNAFKEIDPQSNLVIKIHYKLK